MLHTSALSTFLRTVILLALASSLRVSASDKKPAPPSKPTSAAKPAGTSSAPASGAHPGTASTTHGPTTSGSTTHGVTTTGVRTSGGISTTHPSGGISTRGTGMHTTASAPHEPLSNHGPLAHPGPAGSREVRVAGGGAVRMRANGRPSDFHDPKRGMDIHRNLAGGRRVMVERPDHSRVLFERGRRGYIGHPYTFRGREFARRAYYFHGRAYNRFYAAYGYRGLRLEVYAPWRFYSVGFYGWAYHPWFAPVPYAWGWGPAPWYGYYGVYFAPYPVYASPALWLTDYAISQSLAANYEAASTDGPPPPLGADVAPLSPDVKQMVADEVQRQLALENSEAQMNAAGQPPDPNSSSIARMLADGQPHAFVAGAEVDVTDASGSECAVTDGDVLQLAAPPPANATEAQLMVMSSKGGSDCRKTDVVAVPLDDLQEMQNHMRETVDEGLAELQAKQGHGGLPPAPPSAMAPAATAVTAADAPAPDPAGAQELTAQAQQADQSEQELAAATTPGSGIAGQQPASAVSAATPAAPTSVNITPGQSIADVTAAMGPPARIVNLGPKSIYFYSGMKITFKDGKVSDIE